MVRSPDGESRSFAIGDLTIQRASVWVLEKYYTQFPIFNPYLERLHGFSAAAAGGAGKRKNNAGVTAGGKYFDADGLANGGNFAQFEKVRPQADCNQHILEQKKKLTHISVESTET